MHLLCLSHPRVPLSTEDVRTDRRELAPRPALPDGVGGDSIRAEGALVGKWHSQRNSKQFAPGGLSAERLGCGVACGQLAGPEVPLEGHLPLPPSHPHSVHEGDFSGDLTEVSSQGLSLWDGFFHLAPCPQGSSMLEHGSESPFEGWVAFCRARTCTPFVYPFVCRW